jgi:membrane-associated protease RseP (regulator of RpoE activity)
VEQAKPGPGSTRRLAVPLVLFILTLGTTLWVGGTMWNAGEAPGRASPGLLDILIAGLPYALPLLGILLFHEMGHFVAGRVHRLQVSLPYFIPIPFALGTMGALIIYRSKIASAKKLIDVGVAGPLSGIVVATVLMIIGLNLSSVQKLTPGMGLIIQEGQSLYYLFLKWLVFGRLPEGYDVFLHPVAWASWVGLFVTMINLLPVGQLDGGHVAYALLGPLQNRISAGLHLSMLIFAGFIGLFYGGRALLAGAGLEEVVSESLTGSFWVAWAVVLYILKRLGRGYHPPVSEDVRLDRPRTVVGTLTLVLFVLLFMPIPIRVVMV